MANWKITTGYSIGIPRQLQPAAVVDYGVTVVTIASVANEQTRPSNAVYVAKWGNNTDINSSSIGIEIDNNGFEPFETAQINSLILLLDKLKTQYKIPADNFIGHGDIAPKRKVDPNIHFPWNQLALNGYGVWYTPDSTKNLPESLSVPLALSIVGYDVSDTTSAILAFKRHFRQDSTSQMSLEDRSVLYQLIQRKLTGK